MRLFLSDLSDDHAFEEMISSDANAPAKGSGLVPLIAIALLTSDIYGLRSFARDLPHGGGIVKCYCVVSEQPYTSRSSEVTGEFCNSGNSLVD